MDKSALTALSFNAIIAAGFSRDAPAERFPRVAKSAPLARRG